MNRLIAKDTGAVKYQKMPRRPESFAAFAANATQGVVRILDGNMLFALSRLASKVGVIRRKPSNRLPIKAVGCGNGLYRPTTANSRRMPGD